MSAVRAAAVLALLVLAARGGRADSIVVAGHRVNSRVAFVTASDDVYAPLLPALRWLGANPQVTNESVRITTAAQQVVLISRTRPEATRDGVLRDMPSVPRKQGTELMLPAKAVGSLLGCAVRWEESSRTLFIHPWIRKFTLDTLADRYRITVIAEGPITYTSGRVEEGAPRLFVDIADADLSSIPSELTLAGGTGADDAQGSYLRAVRIKQKSLAPAPEGDVVRLVVEMAEWKPYRISLGEGRRTLQIDLPLPGEKKVAPEAAPVTLSRMWFRRVTPRLAIVTVSTFGTAVCESGATDDPAAIWVDFANADNRLTSPTATITDKLVTAVSVGRSPEKPNAQRLTISLTGATEHRLVAERGEVRVLLGTVEVPDLCVVVDAGHGGHDTGAIGRSGLLEKDVNLDIAQRVARDLEAMGVRVRMTRSDDSPVIPWSSSNREEHRRELQARCSIADDCGAQLFVSIHANARGSNSRAIRGTETYYRKPDSRRFAEVMQEEVVRAAGLPDGGAKYHPQPIIVLCQTNVPAVLVEVGYLSNSADEAKLADPDFRDQAAEGIANGVKRYAEEGGVISGIAAPRSAPAPSAGEQGSADQGEE
jgi:N-acetylmuramoyl-L-alanine amidase